MNNKRIKILFTALPAALLLILSGCVKEHEGYVDFSKTSDFVILTGAGLGNVKASNVIINADTITRTITVDLASKDNSNGAVTVSLGVDAAQITAYNSANGTDFQPFPADAYKLASTNVTVPAGQHYGTTTVEIYRNKLDPTVSYMLPISITDGGGKGLSSNQNTIYYNVIGNLIGGSYTQEWIRWNNADGSGTPAFDVISEGLFIPLSKTSISAENPTGIIYVLSFTNNNGTLTDFKLSLDAESVKTAGITITSGPTIKVADPVNGKYEFTFGYNNSSGAPRVIIDKFTR